MPPDFDREDTGEWRRSLSASADGVVAELDRSLDGGLTEREAAIARIVATYVTDALVAKVPRIVASIGPGHITRARRDASLGQSRASPRAIDSPLTCTMSGLWPGRPLTRKTRWTAASLSARAPSPYTVSVGNATSPPARSRSAARATCASTFSSGAGCRFRSLTSALFAPRHGWAGELGPLSALDGTRGSNRLGRTESPSGNRRLTRLSGA